jgi:peptidoglycan L-alanyl-D-glutamate endopeptidase CwlK
MTDRSLDDLHRDLKPLCQQWLDQCKSAGLSAFIIFTWRSAAEQDALYAQGRTAPGPVVTYARGGQSMHNFTQPDGTPASKAFDFGLLDNAGKYITQGSDHRYAQAGAIGKNMGMVWGGDWPQPKTDFDHFELAATSEPDGSQ